MKRERLQTNKFNIGDIVKIINSDDERLMCEHDDLGDEEFRIVGITSDANFKVRYMMATNSIFVYEDNLELVKTHQEMEEYLDSINY